MDRQILNIHGYSDALELVHSTGVEQVELIFMGEAFDDMEESSSVIFTPLKFRISITILSAFIFILHTM